MSSIITLNYMDLDVAKSRASYYASNRLIKVYFSMPNIMLMTPERQSECRPPRLVPMELETLTELNVAIPVTYVKLQDTDTAITDPVVTMNTVKPIRADHFGNVLKNSSGDYWTAHIVPSYNIAVVP
ncbi:unnamed protein product [Macrosiphum euphorbiae]|uniref:Uncharacterized protein n=1 Tax=Macrosiphum euphorbiae TaxID=13131 RepID=A0AAV0X5N4_9HEMI|nr:unnamed protein product [Macrosiphum euphorbiae]